jgi:DNA-binding MarR family transcriptional regulator
MVDEPSPRTLASRPGFLLSRVGTAVQSGFKDVLARWRMRPLHFLLLSALRANAGPSQQELCQALGIDSGNMVKLLDDLEGWGYLRRTRDPTDRRRHVVAMTASGGQTLAQIAAAVDDFDRRFLEPLDEPERRRLVELLTRLYAATPEARGRGYAVSPPTGARGS